MIIGCNDRDDRLIYILYIVMNIEKRSQFCLKRNNERIMKSTIISIYKIYFLLCFPIIQRKKISNNM